jgi:hypothetical protein
MGYLGSGNLAKDSGSGSITVPGGTTFLLVVVSHDSTPVTSAATIGGNAMTQRTNIDWYYNTRNMRTWYYVNPPTGSQTLAVTGAGLIYAGWIAYDAIDTGTPFAGADGSQETDEVTDEPSIVVSSAVGETAVLALVSLDSAGGQTGVTSTGDTTSRLNTFQDGEGVYFLDEPGAASVTIQALRTGAAGIWSFGGLAMRLAAAAGGGGGGPMFRGS